MLTALAACSPSDPIKCSADTDCLQGGIAGTCLDSPSSSEHWCAFSDPGCSGTALRWGVKSGDDLAGECVAEPTVGEDLDLTVTIEGRGEGRVVSTPAGIDCPGTCRATFTAGTRVTLTGTPASDAFFDGWSGGGCEGRAECAISVGGAIHETASFLLSASTRELQSYRNVLLTDEFADDSLVAINHVSSGQGNFERVSLGNNTTLWSTPVIGEGDLLELGDIRTIDGEDVFGFGSLDGSTSIGTGHVLSDSSTFVARLQGDSGAVSWAVPLPGLYMGSLDQDIFALDSEGNSYIAATFVGTIQIGNTTLSTATSSDRDVYVAKLSPQGAIQWVVQLASDKGDRVDSLGVGNDGQVVVAATPGAGAKLAQTDVPSFGGSDCVIAKLAATDGHALFVDAIGTTGSDGCSLVAVSRFDGRIALFANSPTEATISSTGGTTDGGLAIIFYSPAGGVEAINSLGANASVSTASIADAEFGPDGTLWTTGSYTGSVSFGGTPLPSRSVASGFVAAFATTGSHRRSFSFGGASTSEGERVLSSASSITITGHFKGIADFGGQTLVGGDGFSAFRWKLVP